MEFVVSEDKVDLFSTPPISPERIKKDESLVEEKDVIKEEKDVIKEDSHTEDVPAIDSEKESHSDREDDILEKTPIIRITTPIRKKEPEFKEIPRVLDFSIDSPISSPLSKAKFNSSPARQNKVYHSPKPDYSDEDVINRRVNFLINNPNDITYDNENDKVVEACYRAFEAKYKSLSVNYPDYNIEYPEGKHINKIHSKYHEYIKNIYVNLNLPQTQIMYAICLFVLEFVLIKAFGIPASGLTSSELKKLYKHNTLLIELGESFYSTSYGGEPESLEWRLFKTLAWNIILFIGVKLITNYIGAEEYNDVTRNLIEKMTDNNINRTTIETGEAREEAEDNQGLGDLLESVGGGLFSGGSTDLIDLLGGIGSSFTSGLEKQNRKGKKRERRRRPIFEE